MYQIKAFNKFNEGYKGEKTMKSKKAKIIAGIIGGVIVTVALTLFITLYLVPYNEVKAEYNVAREQFDVEATALEKINKKLNDNIKSLHQVITAKDNPIDEFLISSAQDVINEAREYSEKSVPKAPRAPLSIEKVKPVALEVLKLKDTVSKMADYNNKILTKVKNTKTEYRSLIENFKTAETEVEWVGVDKESTVLRFATKLSNPNNAILRDLNIEWIAYDADGAVVGNHSGSQPDIPANGYVYYVGGAGSANLSGTPATVEVKVTSEGLLTNRVAPKIDVSNIQLKNNGFSWYTVSAECKTDTEVKTSQLDGEFIVKDANGKIIDADFWYSENLPDTIKEEGKFKVSEDYFDLPAIPKSAEVYMYYKWN